MTEDGSRQPASFLRGAVVALLLAGSALGAVRPGPAQAQALGTQCLNTHPDSAVGVCTRAWDADRGNADLAIALSEALRRAGEARRAVTVLESAQAAGAGGSALSHALRLARSYLEEQEFQERQRAGRSGAAETVTLRVERIKCTTLSGRTALKACDAALALAPDDPDLMAARRRIVASLGLGGGSSPDTAQTAQTTAPANTPDSPPPSPAPAVAAPAQEVAQEVAVASPARPETREEPAAPPDTRAVGSKPALPAPDNESPPQTQVAEAAPQRPAPPREDSRDRPDPVPVVDQAPPAVEVEVAAAPEPAPPEDTAPARPAPVAPVVSAAAPEPPAPTPAPTPNPASASPPEPVQTAVAPPAASETPAPSGASAPSLPAPGSPEAASIVAQLATLQALRDHQLIDETEFNRRRTTLLNSAFGPAPDARGQAGTAAQAPEDPLGPFADISFGDYHALVIGIEEYSELPALATAVRDAEAVAEVLRELYDFKVRLLTNVTRSDIIEALDDYRSVLGPSDNLLIYYAGHGWLDEQADQGYWMPVNARLDRRSNWVSNATIRDATRALPAKHVLVVADSCFAGTLTRGLSVPDAPTPAYLARMASKRARLAMSSGGIEPVADDAGTGHSPFAKALIGALRENDTVIDGTNLFARLRRPVILNSAQTPEYSDIRLAGHEGGDFLFVRRRE